MRLSFPWKRKTLNVKCDAQEIKKRRRKKERKKERRKENNHPSGTFGQKRRGVFDFTIVLIHLCVRPPSYAQHISIPCSIIIHRTETATLRNCGMSLYPRRELRRECGTRPPKRTRQKTGNVSISIECDDTQFCRTQKVP